jgi:hypothetical protein
MSNQWMPKKGKSSVSLTELDIDTGAVTPVEPSQPTPIEEEEGKVLLGRYSYTATLKIGFKPSFSMTSQAEARRESQQLVEEYLNMVTRDHSEDPPAPVIKRRTG